MAKEAEKNRRRALERTLAGLPAEKREDHQVREGHGEGVRRELRTWPPREVYSIREGAACARDRTTGGGPTARSHRGHHTELHEGAIGGRRFRPDDQHGNRRTEQGRRAALVRSLAEGTQNGRTQRRGQALSPEEEGKLLNAIVEQTSPNRSQTLATFVQIALLTGMRSGEIAGLTWGQLDLARRIITVGKAKTASGTGRQIPINAELFEVLAFHAKWFIDRFGETKPEHYLFPFGKPTPSDPMKPITDITGAWDTLRKRAGVECRLHDLRHTAATKMAEAGVPESTMLALMGHMSRAMLERYSHIRMAAKREAVEALTTQRKTQNSEQSRTKSLTVEERQKLHLV